MTCPHCDVPLDPTAPAVACRCCGRAPTVCGGFAVGLEVGRGGVAKVREATHADGRSAVVKVLERTAFNPWQVHQLFARSARLAAAFDHPALPRIIGFEQTDRRSFLAMERLRGGTLSERVVARRFVTGAAFEELLRALLEAVAYLHARRFVHGDVTPRNVMFRAEHDLRPVLVDLDGLCSPDERGLPSLVMTPGYTAPEQKAGSVSEVSDLYGVGATMIFAATGRSPDQVDRSGDDRALAVSLPGVSPEARRVVQRLVDLDPRHRPRSARAALRALDARPRGRSSTGLLLAAAAVAMLVLSIAFAARAGVLP